MKANKMALVGHVLSALLTLLFLFSASGKLAGSTQAVEGMTKMGWENVSLIAIGVVEVICALLYIVPITSVIGAILLTGYLGGAIGVHVRIGEPVYAQVVFGILVWGGIYLRDSRLRQLIPLRR